MDPLPPSFRYGEDGEVWYGARVGSKGRGSRQGEGVKKLFEGPRRPRSRGLWHGTCSKHGEHGEKRLVYLYDGEGVYYSNLRSD